MASPSAPPPSYEASTYKDSPGGYQPPPYGATDTSGYPAPPGFRTTEPRHGIWIGPGEHFYAQPTAYTASTQYIRPYFIVDEPMGFYCPSCQRSVWSNTHTEIGIATWLWSALLCFIFCPLFWIPFVCDPCKDISHTCPICNYKLAEMKRI
ncbi:lipopolysaccharide-induced tumor necrosis factor-alpha factor-like [Convolutriloba macropyga]|uniref:lipopolysaccharide-induced tumor necrosis factor-alpha factor-like n=1 Tax=Convolutriloba macropyga TaxID=536237 RepID=UPI003F5204AD